MTLLDILTPQAGALRSKLPLGLALRIAGPAPTMLGFDFWRARGDRRIRIVG